MAGRHVDQHTAVSAAQRARQWSRAFVTLGRASSLGLSVSPSVKWESGWSPSPGGGVLRE
jgi:hypothetical protein